MKTREGPFAGHNLVILEIYFEVLVVLCHN